MVSTQKPKQKNCRKTSIAALVEIFPTVYFDKVLLYTVCYDTIVYKYEKKSYYEKVLLLCTDYYDTVVYKDETYSLFVCIYSVTLAIVSTKCMFFMLGRIQNKNVVLIQYQIFYTMSQNTVHSRMADRKNTGKPNFRFWMIQR